MTRSPARRDRARAAAVTVALLALTVSGCTAGTSPSAGPSPAATPAAADPPSGQISAEPVTGTGPSPYPGNDLPLTDGARSVIIEFACEGGHEFSVELGDSMAQGQAPLSGTSDGVTDLAWPVTGRASTSLSVVIPEGVDWSATPLFSAEEFFIDPDLEAECERAIVPLSALSNAESGFTVYAAFDETEWASRLDGAATELAAMGAESRTSLADSFTQLAAIASASDRVPGELLARTQEAHNRVSATCAENQTAIYTIAEFGG
ncbi:hypothetical protein OVN20_10535 [Microcella daejeonensis]|uniref:hypothetical protein n=1 Tax=Microcella daejeonensis TaxID=2994971 RepID=UPI0022707650|nr:hypothetical protein [Microcella daejeonensis]WAB83488.1 hypothetical protein OVN20_10535 [Microcella daejeonensis]